MGAAIKEDGTRLNVLNSISMYAKVPVMNLGSKELEAELERIFEHVAAVNNDSKKQSNISFTETNMKRLSPLAGALECTNSELVNLILWNFFNKYGMSMPVVIEKRMKEKYLLMQSNMMFKKESTEEGQSSEGAEPAKAKKIISLKKRS